MSPSDERASDAVPGDPQADSVYDFLYHDARRVGSFLAQFDPSGHLTSLKQTEAAETGSSMRFGATAGASAVVAKGGASFDDQRNAAQRETLERAYDPLWTNARALLDFLAERDMICRDLTQARIGQFVLASGLLSVMDLTLWKGLWSLPAVQEVIKAGIGGLAQETSQTTAPPKNRSERRALERGAQNGRPKTTMEHQFDAAMSMLGMLPHSVQARLLDTSGTTVWSSLSEENLVVSAPDLTLKHGVTVAGHWTMLGVLDALPEPNSVPDAAQALVAASAFGELMLHLTPAIRGLLGRPERDYGMTPLMIFREIAI